MYRSDTLRFHPAARGNAGNEAVCGELRSPRLHPVCSPRAGLFQRGGDGLHHGAERVLVSDDRAKTLFEGRWLPAVRRKTLLDLVGVHTVTPQEFDDSARTLAASLAIG